MGGIGGGTYSIFACTATCQNESDDATRQADEGDHDETGDNISSEDYAGPASRPTRGRSNGGGTAFGGVLTVGC